MHFILNFKYNTLFLFTMKDSIGLELVTQSTLSSHTTRTKVTMFVNVVNSQRVRQTLVGIRDSCWAADQDQPGNKTRKSVIKQDWDPCGLYHWVCWRKTWRSTSIMSRPSKGDHPLNGLLEHSTLSYHDTVKSLIFIFLEQCESWCCLTFTIEHSKVTVCGGREGWPLMEKWRKRMNEFWWKMSEYKHTCTRPRNDLTHHARRHPPTHEWTHECTKVTGQEYTWRHSSYRPRSVSHFSTRVIP